MPAPNAKHGKYSALFSKNKKTATENLGGCIMKIVLCIEGGYSSSSGSTPRSCSSIKECM